MAEERNEILPDMEELPYTRPTADAGTSDDANFIGTTDNVRPADRFAPGGSGDGTGTIGNATGPLATPTPPAEGDAYPIAEDDAADRNRPIEVNGIQAGGAARRDLPRGPVASETPIGSGTYGEPENATTGTMPPIGANLAQTGIGGEVGPHGATSADGTEEAGDPGASGTGSSQG